MSSARWIIVAVAALTGCGLRTIPSPDGGAGGLAGGGVAGGGAEAGGAGGAGGVGGGCGSVNDCPAKPNSAAACESGVCTYACTTPYLACTNGCCAAVGVAAGSEHTCAVLDDGAVLCWGQGITIGDGTFSARPRPTRVLGLVGKALSLAAGNMFTCALLESGAVQCWGAESIGHGSLGPSTTAATPMGLTGGVSSLSAGGAHACVVVDGGVRCWGSDGNGVQGCNACGARGAPGAVSGLAYDVKQVVAGNGHECALLTDGGTRCWGYNLGGQCGDGQAITPQPVPIEAIAFDGGVDALFASFTATCGLRGDQVYCFGLNGVGELAVRWDAS